MSITKEIIEDSHEIKGDYKHIHVRTATVIKEDGVEISRTYHRHVVTPEMDASSESAEVKKLVTQFHTDAVITAYKKHLEDNN